MVDEALRNGEHRRALESEMMKGAEKRANRGQWMALAVTFGVFVTSFLLAVIGSPTIGGVLAGGTLVSLVGIFVYGSTQQRLERQFKLETLGHGDRAEHQQGPEG